MNEGKCIHCHKGAEFTGAASLLAGRDRTTAWSSGW